MNHHSRYKLALGMLHYIHKLQKWFESEKMSLSSKEELNICTGALALEKQRESKHSLTMVGNAVPVNLAHALATQIMIDIRGFNIRRRRQFVCGSLRVFDLQRDRRSA